MKKPKLIFTYQESVNNRCNVKEYFINVYKPSEFNDQPKYFFQFADQLFSIRGQSNTEQSEHPGKGMKSAYALRVEDLEFGKADAFVLASKTCKDLNKDGSLPQAIKRLRSAGAVRYALADVITDKGSHQREFVPRRYARKSVAYWSAINAGLEVQP